MIAPELTAEEVERSARELRSRIVLLLEFYREVEEGLADYSLRSEGETPLRLMSRSWNHMSYRQLERLIYRLRTERPFLYLHLRRRFFDYREVRRSRCPRCGEHPAAHVGKVHAGCKVKGRSSELVPVVVRVYPEGLDASRLEAALDWLCVEWRGPCELPAVIAEITRERAFRACA